MPQIIEIDLYQSAEAPAGSYKMTSMRKLYTSLLVVLLFIATGTAGYFVYSGQEQAGAVPDNQPTKPIKPPLGVIIRKNNIRWAKFISEAIKLSPKAIVSDGDEGYLVMCSVATIEEARAIRDSIQRMSREIAVVDTFSKDEKLNVIFKGILAQSLERDSGQPVSKILRTTIMNMIDSIATLKGLVEPKRQILDIMPIENGECYRYLFSAEGGIVQISRFFDDIENMQYCVSPSALRIQPTDSSYTLEMIWGLYDFAPIPPESSAVAQGK